MCGLPSLTFAELKSENYSIRSFSIGDTRGTYLTSQNYSFTSNIGTIFTNNTPTNSKYGSVVNKSGNGSILSTTTSATAPSTNVHGIATRTPIVNTVSSNIKVALLSGEDTTFSSEEIDEKKDESDLSKDYEKQTFNNDNTNFLANLISSDVRGIAKYIQNTFENMFDYFYSRLILFFIIMALFLCARTRTRIGKKWLP